MATITEVYTAQTSNDYTTPVYVKKVQTGFNLYCKIFDATRMLVVDVTTGLNGIRIDVFPSGAIPNIHEQTTSDETEFETQLAVAQAAIDAIMV
jgi:hypothetical protein